MKEKKARFQGSPFVWNSFQTKIKAENRLQSLELQPYTARSTMKEAGKDLLGGTHFHIKAGIPTVNSRGTESMRPVSKGILERQKRVSTRKKKRFQTRIKIESQRENLLALSQPPSLQVFYAPPCVCPEKEYAFYKEIGYLKNG